MTLFLARFLEYCHEEQEIKNLKSQWTKYYQLLVQEKKVPKNLHNQTKAQKMKTTNEKKTNPSVWRVRKLFDILMLEPA